MLIGNTGVAVRLSGIGIGHVDKRLIYLRYNHLMTIWIVSRFLHVLYCGLLAEHIYLTLGGIRETKGLRLKRTFYGVVRRILYLVVSTLLFWVNHLDMVVVLHLHRHIAYLLAYLDIVLQRHILALQVTYQVVERQCGIVNVQRQRVLNLLALLHLQTTALERHTVGNNPHVGILQVARTDVCLRIVDVLQYLAVALQRDGYRPRVHLVVVEQRVAFLYRQLKIFAQIERLSLYFYV